MSKYQFQQGGGFDYTDTDFFNSILDGSQRQNYTQQYQPDNSVQDAPDQESDYIKNLRSYDQEQQSGDINSRLDELEQRLNSRFDDLQNQQQTNAWSASDDGQDYFSDLYDSRTDSNPVTIGSLEQRQLQAESGGDNYAVSSAGAQGAYQFMPKTWETYKPRPDASPNNRADAQQAYHHYMSDLMTEFGGNQRQATAAYNAGSGRIHSAIKQYGNDWEAHIPTETKGYLHEIFDGGIKTKPGATIQNVNQGLLDIVGNVSKQFPGITVTSGTDGQHMQNSAHYDGEAVDIGANSSNPAAYQNFKQQLPQLQRKYGIKYLDEGDHIHVSLSTHGKT